MISFRFIKKQLDALALLASNAVHILLRGGSRSGKTFVIITAMIARALCAPGSRQVILGFRFNRVRTSIGMDTFPKVLKLVYPQIKFELNKSDWYYRFENGSEIWLAGLDDKDRTEKVLGHEFCGIFFNECSMISYESIELALTRLAQKVLVKYDVGTLAEHKPTQERELRMKVFYDENPPKKSHWSYRQFIKKVQPLDGKPLPDPENYVEMKMNPEDNKANLAAGYLESLNTLSASRRRRFRDGEFASADPNQLFDEDTIERYRIIDIDELPDMVRIVVMVDPSGADDTDNETNDDIGIVVAGLGTDGIGYILEDLTVKAGPKTWGQVACNAYEFHDADLIGGETNYGGAMVKHVIRTVNPRIPFHKVTATRGKVVRAEPVSSLYEQGKICHVGYLRQLEDELTQFTTHGYAGSDSPNRADAAIWASYELFPWLTKQHDDDPPEEEKFEPFDSGAGY